MIQEFQGDKESAAEEELFRWQAGHPKGFAVNCASSGWKLHRAKCPNLWPDDPGVCMTHSRKISHMGYSQSSSRRPPRLPS